MAVSTNEYTDFLTQTFLEVVGGDEERARKLKYDVKAVLKEERFETFEEARLVREKKYPLVYDYVNWLFSTMPIMIRANEKAKYLFPKKEIGTVECIFLYKRVLQDMGCDSNDVLEFFKKINLINFNICYNWNVYKQVYDFDYDCFEYLLNNTSHEGIATSLIKDNLPFTTFAINNAFEYKNVKISQIIVSKIQGDDDKWYLAIYYIYEAPDYDYFYVFLPLEEEGKTIVSSKDIDFKGQYDTMAELVDKTLSLILYICSSNKEVREVSKKNGLEKNREKYRQKVGIKSEELGYVLGSTIRQHKVKYVNNESEPNTPHKVGSSKRPHIRSGHFHHYWVGQGRTECIIKFVEPMFIKGGADNVVMHKVKK